VFTGIVREVGHVVAVEGDDAGLTLRVEAPRTAEGLAVGDTVAVAGV
jgi:riboflavin synthase alpha subunit